MESMENKEKSKCNIIPVPKQVKYYEGIISIPMKIYTTEERWNYLLNVFCMSAKRIFNIDFSMGTQGIELVFDADIDKSAYSIRIDKKVTVCASDSEGANYGLVSVLQLAIKENNGIVFERMNILDQPDKEYRGLMIDLANEWHPYECLTKYIDICYYFKVKYLHLHVMDDNGYVLPSNAFSRLSLDGKKYTFDQIRLLCEYARQRHVELIPEIEMPGHIRILNELYPELFSNVLDIESEYLTTDVGRIMDSKTVLCPGSTVAFESIKELVDEVISIFDGVKHLHLGGDEVITSVWERCPVCIKYMQENNIKDVQELYAEFLARISKYVLDKGIVPIIWEGFSKEYSKRIPKDVIVMAWETMYQTPQSLLEEGFKIINCSWKPLYLVSPYSIEVEKKGEEWGIKEILNWNVYEWQNWWDETESGLNPIHIQPTESLLGAQVCSWGLTFEGEISFIVRFVAATMERTWSTRRFRSYVDYTRKYNVQSKKAFRLINS